MGENRGPVESMEVEVGKLGECCLPHCGLPGHKLDCGHYLCGMDMLKLTKFISQLIEFRFACPMCRKTCIVSEEKFVDMMVETLPFKCLVVGCGCVRRNCNMAYFMASRPCKAHKSHACTVCVGGKRSRMCVKMVDSSDDDSG